ncbi:NAD(P)H-dependent oxidoreductase [Romboutsia sp. 1001216sp1]|uniref:NAD(P)H-dependent oxidoreductase n=1 Tax=unclassified Romboutsia TaxID=2626894 RepID=UPI00189EB82F|nr:MULTISPECIES: NAD(P)H-dependent oxidoreductase [unclassified Romboutsia]MDB8790290.1 NAD(P)H-dependent oxidoreductase [Romboutsia sp. 1001216sp1]MDB8793533.1 NAD(P)H-dependent oxidoreductase [Romboutsia sp. 1001216sp1]MDB8794930.1 NAD(P)H-dependent oxidoreductase [Romboutsia sp. 1001216sp1]MDB8798741.1 NAD(P)H-dependent oxidoreductase [Romboutsia sp. 1001216sp1]MDB8801537.1 NAD(P)H-dependent oxidoreductase [Romboutsia sp. 1001216sp1]
MKTTIIVASPSEKSFSKKIVEKLSKKLIENRAEYEIIDLYKDNFNPVMTEKEEQLYNEGKTDDELVKKYQQSIRNSDEIILVFPVWFNNVPAILKGFFDKVFIKNFAFSEEDNKTKGLLSNIKSGMVITTSESNTSYLKDKLNNPIETVIIKGTLEVCGMKNIKYINLNVEDKEKEDVFESYFK